jgi:SNF2 family DNA or RNA helicase
MKRSSIRKGASEGGALLADGLLLKQQPYLFSLARRLPIVDVMVAPELGSALREHQVKGVRFLYDRIMGFRSAEEDDHLGAILADEMGLGK